MHYHEHAQKGGGGGFTLGFLVGAAATIIAGGYYLYGPLGRDHRKGVERWLEDVQDDVLERMRSAKDLSRDAYERIVEEVTESYALGKRLTGAQAKRAASRLKARWEDMKQRAQDAAEEAELEADLDK